MNIDHINTIIGEWRQKTVDELTEICQQHIDGESEVSRLILEMPIGLADNLAVYLSKRLSSGQ